MVADDTVALRPARLVIITNCDAGFLWERTQPLVDVEPGAVCSIECVASKPLLIEEVLVRDFALEQLSIGAQLVKAPVVERGALPRFYRLATPLMARADQTVVARLRNDGHVPIKQKIAVLVDTLLEYRTSAPRRLPE